MIDGDEPRGVGCFGPTRSANLVRLLDELLGDESHVDGVVIRAERDEDTAGTPGDQQSFGVIVGNLSLAGLDHGTRNTYVVIRELEEFVVAQVGDLLAGEAHVALGASGDEESLQPSGEGGRGGVARVQGLVEAVVDLEVHLEGRCSCGRGRDEVGVVVRG